MIEEKELIDIIYNFKKYYEHIDDVFLLYEVLEDVLGYTKADFIIREVIKRIDNGI